ILSSRIIYANTSFLSKVQYNTGLSIFTVLGAMGLVVNVIVLWNTYYMDAAIDKLRSLDQQVLPEDIVRLSPLGRKHINMLGWYYFSLAETVERGELRPLRDSNASEDFELI
uniref:Tn3 family transposase n=1 Tax=uncultured Nostoc sp. TaxID=340711 RepID=UPI0035C95697